MKINKIYHKYNAKPTKVDGVRYDSKKEALYAKQLKIRQAAGEILFYLEQVPFSLPGGIKYRLDFMEFHAPKDGDQGDVIFTEVKGYMTSLARSKISMVEDLYNISINIV